MEGLDALLERRFIFSVCFRTAIGLAGEGEVLAGKGEGLFGKEKDLGERKRAKRNYEREIQVRSLRKLALCDPAAVDLTRNSGRLFMPLRSSKV